MNTDEIAFAIGSTPRLLREYEQIIDEYKRQGYNLNNQLENKLHIESNLEIWILENAVK